VAVSVKGASPTPPVGEGGERDRLVDWAIEEVVWSRWQNCNYCCPAWVART